MSSLTHARRQNARGQLAPNTMHTCPVLMVASDPKLHLYLWLSRSVTKYSRLHLVQK